MNRNPTYICGSAVNTFAGAQYLLSCSLFFQLGDVLKPVSIDDYTGFQIQITVLLNYLSHLVQLYIIIEIPSVFPHAVSSRLVCRDCGLIDMGVSPTT